MTSRPKGLTVDQSLQNRSRMRALRSRYMPVETTDLRTIASSHVAKGSQWTPPTGRAQQRELVAAACAYSGPSAWRPVPTASCTSGLSMGPCLTHARSVGHVGACRGPLRTTRPCAHVPCSWALLREHMPCLVSMHEARCSSMLVGALARMRAACSRSRGRVRFLSSFVEIYPAASRMPAKIHEPTETLGSVCERPTAYRAAHAALRPVQRRGGACGSRISITSRTWGRSDSGAEIPEPTGLRTIAAAKG
jgi:hypothetical protein